MRVKDLKKETEALKTMQIELKKEYYILNYGKEFVEKEISNLQRLIDQNNNLINFQ